MLDPADNGDVMMRDLAILDGLDRERRKVDDDVAVAEREVHAGETLRARGELLEPRRRGYVHRLQSRPGDDPRLAQAHARLEMLDRGGDRRIPLFGARPERVGRFKIALGGEALAQDRHG